MSISAAHQRVIDDINATTGVVRSATAALNTWPDRVQAIRDQAVADGATVEELVALLDTELAAQRTEVAALAAAIAANP